MRLAAVALVLSVVLAGCVTQLDLPRLRRAFTTEAKPTPPVLRETPAADLPAPVGLRATTGELRSVPLMWAPLLVGKVGGYVVERATDANEPFERIAVRLGRQATTHVDEVDADGTLYYYRVRAFDPTGSLASRASEVVAATTAQTPPAPADLRAYSHQPREVPLSWYAPSDPNVVGYRIERSPSSQGPFELITDLVGRHSTAYVDRGLGDLRVFYYRVSARNAAGGIGDASEPVRAVTKPEPLPPLGLRVVEQRLGANVLTWENNVERDVSTYRVFRFRAGTEVPELVAEIGADSATTAVDADVGAGEAVAYTATALDTDGLQSAAAESVKTVSESYKLSAAVKADGVHLNWDPRPGEGFHRARVARVGLLNESELGFSESGDFVDSDVKPGGKYRYVVVLERPDLSQAPRSSPVDIRVPER